MSQWTDRIRNHPIWKALEDLGPSIDGAAARSDLDPTSLDGLERLRAVLAFAGKKLASLDPFLAHPGPLDAMAPALQTATNELAAFISDGNAARIGNANKHADVLLSHLAGLPGPVTVDDLTTIGAAAASYRTAVEQHLTQISAHAGDAQRDLGILQTRLAQIETDLTKERDRLTALVTEQQGQFATAQAARQTKYDEIYTEQQAQFTAAQTDRQDRYTKLTTDTSERLSKLRDEFSKEGDTARKEHQDALKALKEGYDTSAGKILQEITNKKQEVESLLGVIGNLGVSAGYQKAADQARKSAINWQRLTVASMLGFIGVAVYAFIPIVQGGAIGWEGFAARVFITLTVGVLAAYAGSQADKQSKSEARNRRLAVEFEALGPFLAPLPEKLRDEFRIEVGQRSFGAPDDIHAAHDKSPVSVIDVIAEIEKSAGLKENIKDALKALAAKNKA